VRVLTLARDLRRRKARERQGLFVAEGVRAVEELVRSPLAIVGVLLAPQLADAPRGAALRASLAARGSELSDVSEREFASAAETEAPQGVLAIGEIPDRSLASLTAGPRLRLLVLDAVQDPGNVGTIVRTAAALGADATVALPGTVDLWNAKVVRSAMGAQFHHPAFAGTWDAVEAFLAAHGIPLWAADANGEPVGTLRAAWRTSSGGGAPGPLALVVGNEGAGLSQLVLARASQRVSIPIAPMIESLNVAVATGILLHELRP
jgi:RNA methyltransferase, TrmH family